MALAGGVGVACAPSLTARLTDIRVAPGDIVRVELSGSGAAMLKAAGGDPRVLVTHRRLAVLDNTFIAAYTVPLVLGISLLPSPGRGIGLGLTALAAVADLNENAALVRALDLLATDPAHATVADRPARRARQCALVKFTALIPAAGLAAWGITHALLQGPGRP